MFANRVFLTIAKVSYPLYLIHQNLAYEIEYNLTNLYGYYHVFWGVVAIVVVIIPTYGLYVFDRRLSHFLQSKE